MGFRVRKRIKIAPGLGVNLSKSGASLTVGPRGAKVNVGKKGVRGTVGVPGTGVSYSETITGRAQTRGKARRTDPAQAPARQSSGPETYRSELADIAPVLEDTDRLLLRLQTAVNARDDVNATALTVQAIEVTQSLQIYLARLTPPPELESIHRMIEKGLQLRYEGLVAQQVALQTEKDHPERDSTPALEAAVDHVNQGTALLLQTDRELLEMESESLHPHVPLASVQSGARGGSPLVCQHCWTENGPEALFCSECGKRLERSRLVQRIVAGKAEMMRETRWGRYSKWYWRATLAALLLLLIGAVTPFTILLVPALILLLCALAWAVLGVVETKGWKRHKKQEHDHQQLRENIERLERELGIETQTEE